MRLPPAFTAWLNPRGRPIATTLWVFAFYGLAFAVLSWPRILQFGELFWLDDRDGYLMTWNLWHAREHPFTLHTTLLHFPRGASLLTHGYHPATSWLVNLWPASLVVRLNLAVFLSFALSGTTLFWLAWKRTGTEWGSLFAGYAFAFSSYRWSHAEGHLNLISTQWIPLFLLVWLLTLERPSPRRGVAAAFVLLAVFLSDYYLGIYCVLAGALIWLWYRPPWRQLVPFVATSLLTSGVLCLGVVWVMQADPVAGAHDPRSNPLDPISLFVPGSHWRWRELTKPIWSQVRGSLHGTSLSIGLSLWALILWRGRDRMLWTLLLFFLVMGFGERLTVLGREFPVPLPYELLTTLVPPLALGGITNRMALMVGLAAALLGAHAVRELRWRAVPFAAVLVFELLPSPMRATPVEPPGWVRALAEHPGDGALLDFGTSRGRAMYYQTFHQRPTTNGGISRVPKGSALMVNHVQRLYERGQFDELRDVGFAYGLTFGRQLDGAELVYAEGRVRLYYFGHLAPPDRGMLPADAR